MNHPVSIRVGNAQDPQTLALLNELREVAHAADGQSAFNDQALADVVAGYRRLLLVEAADSALLGAAVWGESELEFVITPTRRRQGLGQEVLDRVLADHGTNGHSRDLLAWSHGDHPGARALAAQNRFTPVRTLLQLRRDSPIEPSETATSDPAITAFRPGRDEQAWLELNALAFAHHPEQGRLTREDLDSRMAQDWFSAENFLLAHGSDGGLVGFNWLKVEPEHPHAGEIYAIGVHPDNSGQGIGRRLMMAGLARLETIGASTVTLYVEADNTAAVTLYRSLGFTDHTIDVQYLRSGQLQ